MITWGMNGRKEATVFCVNCRTIFASGLTDIPEIFDVKTDASLKHQCTVAKPWKPLTSVVGINSKRTEVTPS